MTRSKFFVLVALGIVGYIGWAVMVYLDPSQRGDFLKLHITVVGGVVALALREMPAAAAPPPPAPPLVPATPAKPQPSVTVPFDPTLTP